MALKEEIRRIAVRNNCKIIYVLPGYDIESVISDINKEIVIKTDEMPEER